MGTCLRAIRFFLPDWKLLVSTLLLILLSILLGVMQSWPWAIMIDCVLSQNHRDDWIHRLFLSFLPSDKVHQVLGIALIGMGMKMLQDLICGVRSMCGNYYHNRAVIRLRDALFKSAEHKRIGSDLTYRVFSDVQGICAIFDTLLYAFIAAFQLVFMAVVMFSTNVRMTWISLSIAPFLVLVNLYFGRQIRRKTLQAKEIDSELMHMVADQSANLSAFKDKTVETSQGWLSLNWLQEGFGLIVKTIFSVGGMAVFAYGSYLVYRDQFQHPIANGMTIGTLAVFLDYLGKLWEPLGRITNVNADLQPGIAGAQRCFETMDAK